jgi:type IV secretory pathway VirB9-like protein
MKRALIFLLTMYAVVTAADELKVSQPAPGEVIHVATALDHLTVLEFGEPVTMAAAGSPAFQIERHEDKVFIKPLKAGASTDLFVWTASRRFAYELEPPGEVKNMNFAVDNRVPAPKPVPESKDQINDIADMMFTRARCSELSAWTRPASKMPKIALLFASRTYFSPEIQHIFTTQSATIPRVRIG